MPDQGAIAAQVRIQVAAAMNALSQQITTQTATLPVNATPADTMAAIGVAVQNVHLQISLNIL